MMLLYVVVVCCCCMLLLYVVVVCCCCMMLLYIVCCRAAAVRVVLLLRCIGSRSSIVVAVHRQWQQYCCCSTAAVGVVLLVPCCRIRHSIVLTGTGHADEAPANHAMTKMCKTRYAPARAFNFTQSYNIQHTTTTYNNNSNIQQHTT